MNPPPLTESGLARGVWLGQQASHVRIQRAIAAGVLLAVALVQAVLFVLIPEYPRVVLYAVLAGLAAVAVAGYWYSGAAFRRYAFRLDELSLRIRRGVVWRKETAVPLNRVQHTDITQGPLQRRHGLARLVIHTAGTRHALVNLEGITYPQATALRQALSFDADSGAV